MSAARDAILSAIGQRRGTVVSVPDYSLPAFTADVVAHFILKAKASVAQLHEIAAAEDAPEAILSIMTKAQLSPRLHCPANSPLHELPWHRASGLALSTASPSGDDYGFSVADYGIAETGTLVFLSGPRSSSSWHFRPGCELVLIQRASILPRMEDVLSRVSAGQPMPATLNLITGPSRTADIEQTIELGAHGPRAVHILVAGDVHP